MKRTAVYAGLLFVGALIAVFCVGCHRERQLEEQIDQRDAFTLDAGLHLEDDSHQQAHLDDHTIDTSAPGERVEKDFAPLPDGGTYVAHEATTRWGERKIEAWQIAQIGADEHVGVDAQVSAAGEKTTKGKIVEKEKTDSGGFSLGLKIGALVVLLLVAGAVYVIYRARKLRKELTIL
jgi:hypothetical protein